MNVFQRFAQWWNDPMEGRSVKEPVSEEDLAKYLGGESVWTGVEVNRSSSLGITAVWASVRVLAETLASLPLFLYKRLEKGKERATEHPIYQLLHVRPNPEQSPFLFKETLMGHLALLGNAYAHKVYSKGSAYVKELWPLNPEKMEKIVREGGEIVYYYKKGSQTIRLTREQVFHIPGLGFDGIRGYSPIEIAKQAFGMGIAAERYGADFFQNYGMPGGYLSLKGRLKDKAAMDRLKDSWGNAHKDWGKKHSLGILEEEGEFKQLSIPPEHAQFIETRKFNVTEIARIFRVPPHMIGDLERATFSNIEHQALEFVIHTMRPWLVRWEQAVTSQLLPEREQGTYYSEFLIDALLRGDIAARAEAYQTFREIGMYSANELREMENKNPVENGDDRYVPMNWVKMGEEPEPPALPGPPPPDDQKSVGEVRAAQSRYRLSQAHIKLFSERMARVARRERKDIKVGMKEWLLERNQEDFDLWLEEYYKKFPDYARKVVTPVFYGLNESIKAEIGDEIDVDGKMSPEDDGFLAAYVTIFMQRYTGRSKGEIRRALQEAINEGRDFEEALDEKLDGWVEKRSTELALSETVRGSNAFAKNAYLLAGVIYLRWVALGPKSCPYCSSMDGSIVGIDNSFALPGDQLIENGNPMNINRVTGHPPLHNGCVCQIVAA